MYELSAFFTYMFLLLSVGLFFVAFWLDAQGFTARTVRNCFLAQLYFLIPFFVSFYYMNSSSTELDVFQPFLLGWIR